MATPKPQPNETEFAFTKRAHRELKDSMPDYFDRNKAIWEQWDKYGANATRCNSVADRLLGANYVDLGDPVAYFTEHETVGRDGKPKRFTLADLEDIATQQNFNVLERGRFAAISDDHTTDDRQDRQPDVLGYAVRYRLGQVGYDQPVWTIFAHERAAKSKADRLSGLPRRSVELLTDKRTGKRIFDPIAALGSRAPRLSMPGRYSQEGEVERYAFDAGGVMPGGGNTSLPEQFNHEETPMELNNEALRQIVEAIQSLPQMQWVSQQMQSGGMPVAPGAGSEIGPAPDMGMGAMGGDAGMPPPDDGGLPPGGDEDMSDATKQPPSDEDDRFSLDPEFAREYVERDRYDALQSQVKDMQELLKRQANQIASLSNSRSDAIRTTKLKELENKYRGFVRAEEEMERCLYSHKSSMTDDQFEQHVQDIERFAARAQIQSVGPIPEGVDPQPSASGALPDRYSDDYLAIQKKALERHTADLEAGREVYAFEHYVDEIAKERSERNGKAAV